MAIHKGHCIVCEVPMYVPEARCRDCRKAYVQMDFEELLWLRDWGVRADEALGRLGISRATMLVRCTRYARPDVRQYLLSS